MRRAVGAIRNRPNNRELSRGNGQPDGQSSEWDPAFRMGRERPFDVGMHRQLHGVGVDWGVFRWDL